MKISIIRLVCAGIIAFCLAEESCSTLVTDKMLFVGVCLSYHDRVGYLTLSGDEVESVAREEIPSAGIIVGKRFSLPLGLRIQLPLTLDYGATTENSDQSFDGTVKSTLFHAGIMPALQLPLRVNSEAALYLSAGFGLHIIRFTEKDVDDFLYTFTCPSMSIDGGVGFEKITDKSRAIAIQYSIRYGKPVYYNYVKDLFPFQAVAYKEKIITHSIQFMILIGK